MKLLTKQEISTSKAKERKMEIDEGVKLAKRVDSLREKSAEEEVRLSKFRTESLNKLHKDIDGTMAELDEWVRKVDEAKAQREYLLKPLDEKWDELHQKEEDLRKRESDCDSTIATFEEKIRAIEITEKELTLERQKLSNKEASIDVRLNELEDDRVNVRHELEEATRARINNDILLTETTKGIILRETEVMVREREVLIVEQHNRQVAVNNDKESQKLLDMRQTLERAINRLKK